MNDIAVEVERKIARISTSILFKERTEGKKEENVK